jgi:hypothetical protein
VDVMIDILTVTKRTGWYDIALASIKKQDMDVHWVIVDENMTPQDEHQTLTMDGERFIMTTFLSAPPKTRVSNLNASLNKGLRFCQTDHVIFYQDFIVLQQNCFDDLLDMSTALDDAFVGTVTKNPPGHADDPRYLGLDCLRPAIPDEWEANVAIAPMRAINQLGGFEEELDNGWSWDNVHLARRALMLGFTFYVDEGNRPQLLNHEKELNIPGNGERCEQDLRDIIAGKKPISLNYL